MMWVAQGIVVMLGGAGALLCREYDGLIALATLGALAVVRKIGEWDEFLDEFDQAEQERG